VHEQHQRQLFRIDPGGQREIGRNGGSIARTELDGPTIAEIFAALESRIDLADRAEFVGRGRP
jgi:hypothetical protein